MYNVAYIVTTLPDGVPPNTVPPPKALRLALAAVGVPPSPMLPKPMDPNPTLGAGEATEVFGGGWPKADPPNRGLTGVVVEVPPCPKTLPVENPVDDPLVCPNTGGDPNEVAAAAVV